MNPIYWESKIAEVLADLSTEITEELFLLENQQDLNPDLLNIQPNPQRRPHHEQSN